MGGRSVPRERLEGIRSASYQHPADKVATAALEKVPQLSFLARKYLTHLEWLYRSEVISSSIKLGPTQLPAVYEAHVAALSANLT